MAQLSNDQVSCLLQGNGHNTHTLCISLSCLSYFSFQAQISLDQYMMSFTPLNYPYFISKYCHYLPILFFAY